MRRLSDPEAHRARIAILDGSYPEGMQARCSLCAEVSAIADGRIVSGRGRNPAAQLFVCAGCAPLLPDSAAA